MREWVEKLIGKKSEKCEACGHTTEKLPSVDLVQIPDFQDLLSPEARKVYAVDLPGPVFHSVSCAECRREDVIRPSEATMFMPFGVQVSKTLGFACNNHHTTLHIHAMEYLASTVHISVQDVMRNGPDAVERKLEHRIAAMAAVINRGVEARKLGYGVWCRLIATRLAANHQTFSYGFALAVFIGALVSRDALNEYFGENLFVREGELGEAGAWDRWAEKNL